MGLEVNPDGNTLAVFSGQRPQGNTPPRVGGLNSHSHDAR